MIFFALFIAGMNSIPRFPTGPFKLYVNMTEEQKAQPIPFAVLSTESLHPFVYNGSAARSPQQILTTKNKFKGVRDCLVSSEQNKKQPDLRMVNWDKFSSSEDVSICMWRIFNSLGSRKSAEKWVAFHGFEISKTEENPNILRTHYLRSIGRRALFPTRGFWKLWGHNLTIIWEPALTPGQPKTVSVVGFQSNLL